ncbi:hypothetical protein ABZX88_27040 [Kitasatospora aureofaciens]|uniref:hypothetical protein n=1 Tax=Kitasatospora aureofaciens TaxID=1894 RepID=UPI0033B73571
MSGRYGIVPVDAPGGAGYPVWVIQDHETGHLVKALPPRPEPLRFYSYDQAERWVGANDQTPPPPETA